MRNGVIRKKTLITRVSDREGKSLEQELRTYKLSGETPTAIQDMIYQKRSEGVDPKCDIRTDVHEMAMLAMDTATKTHIKARKGQFKDGTDADGNKITYLTDNNGNVE